MIIFVFFAFGPSLFPLLSCEKFVPPPPSLFPPGGNENTIIRIQRSSEDQEFPEYVMSILIRRSKWTMDQTYPKRSIKRLFLLVTKPSAAVMIIYVAAFPLSFLRQSTGYGAY